MRWFGKPIRPPAESDLQSRLRYIEGRCDDLKKRATEPGVAELAEYVSYLTAIIDKHFRTQET